MEPEKNTSSLEQIKIRAYFLFVGRGSQHGHDVDDWLRAEAELGSADEPR